jgi:hypothetical protein
MEEGERILLSFGRQHIDLIKRVVATDRDTGLETMTLEADPRRYDWEQVEGNWILTDKFEADSMRAEDFFALLRRIIHQPFYHAIQDTSSAGIQKKTLRIFVTGQRPPTG